MASGILVRLVFGRCLMVNMLDYVLCTLCIVNSVFEEEYVQGLFKSHAYDFVAHENELYLLFMLTLCLGCYLVSQLRLS